jgi:hypothetical protein
LCCSRHAFHHMAEVTIGAAEDRDVTHDSAAVDRGTVSRI